MSAIQRYRLRNPATGAERIVHAQPQDIYVERDTKEPLEVVGKLLPLAPSASKLPWAVENLRFCTWCSQLAQKDLNDCPTCGRRMGPLGRETRPAPRGPGGDAPGAGRRARGLRGRQQRL